MKKFFLLTCLILAMVALKAQDEITVKFTSTTQIGSYCPFNAVNVSNLSRNWEEVLVYPDTTLLLQSSVGISERNEISSIEVYPNPFSNWTDASFSLETAANVKVQLFQLTGKEIASYINFLEAGTIQVRITMSQPQMALLVITTSNSRQVAKVLNVGNGNGNSLEVSHYASKNEHNGRKANLVGDFMPGDTMLYEAVAYDNGNILTSEVITKAQYENETIVLSFNVTLPEVSTFEVSNITQTSALGGGEVTLTGGLPVNERGICWGTTHNPTINQNHNSNGSGIGGYSVNMNGLVQNTTYYVRAYAINDVGISYGQEVHFTTLDNISALSVTTSQVTNISQNTAVGGGNVTADGGANVTERGICWNTSHNPTINNSHGSNGSGLGNYTVNMTGLSAGTAYYVRAYAINSQGISYGQEVGFTTTAEPPSVTTSQVTNITQTSATGGGNVTSDGGATVTERGICWSTSHNPTTSGSHGSSGTGTGSYTVSMTGLNANTTYYVRAYATNSVGTAYGSEASFTTTQNVSLPTVTTQEVTNIYLTQAIGGGNVISDGGVGLLERGICWSTSHNPTTSDNHGTSSFTGSGIGSFLVSMNGLYASTTYYVRAYAVNSVGTSYGSEVSFTTVCVPTIITSPVIHITRTTAVGGGNVISNNDPSGCMRGICWSTNHNPTINDNSIFNGTGIGEYSVEIDSLTPYTTYYVRAYAANSAGTAYGEEVSFNTTPPQAPVGAVNGLFSVSGLRMVWLSQGNLQYQASSNTWRFAENQWDYVGTHNPPYIGGSGGTVSGSDNYYTSSTYNGWIDLFGWGTSGYNHGAVCYQPWSTTENYNYYYAYGSWTLNLYDQTGQADWGYNTIVNGGSTANSWRTLTQSEWNYLLNTRHTTSGIRYAKARVNFVDGLIVLPDDWSSSFYVLNNTNQSNSSFSDNIISETQWNILQQQGAVFLPAAGMRKFNSDSNHIMVFYCGESGGYWSSKQNGVDGAYIISFSSSNLNTSNTGSFRYHGRSIRLVQDFYW